MNPNPGHRVGGSSSVACVAEGGCSYLRALARIEDIAGFEHTAKSYAASAERCQRNGCWAAEAAKSAAARAPASTDFPRPIPLPPSTSVKAVSPAPLVARVAETIPFDRSALLDIVSDAAGNFVERRPLKLETLPGRNDPLGYLYTYWRGLRDETELHFSNIDTVHLMRSGIIGKLHVVDVASSDPEDFRFDLFGYALPLGAYEAPRALPVPIYADAIMQDYNTVRLTAAPRLHRIRCRLGDTSHHYTRLILPFLGEDGRVARLAVAIREEPGNGVKVQTGY